jgi:hypothetical protein
MRRIIALILVALVAWRGYETYLARSKLYGRPAAEAPAAAEAGSLFTATQRPPAFKCDGRVYCSQMTSCAEAEYFMSHCPSVKMDGDKNGVPCEKQWCN